MSINREMNKEVWYSCTMEYYSTIEKKEILAFVTTQIDVKDILSETKNRLVVVRGRAGCGRGRCCADFVQCDG